MYVCPYLDLEVLDSYSLVLPSLGPYLGLLVLVSLFTISTHPLPSSYVFSLTCYLTCGMEDLSPLEPLCWTSFPIYLCLGSDFPKLCWLNLKQIVMPSIQCIWKLNEYLIKIPFMKSSIFEHT